MIISDGSLLDLLPRLIAAPHRLPSLVNPASVDVRIGMTMMVEVGRDAWGELRFETPVFDRCAHRWDAGGLPAPGYVCVNCGGESALIEPGGFLLASTLESVTIPNGYAADLKLKSTVAREGWDHSMAFWVDPGWSGILTMEIRNARKYTPLRLACGQRFGQMVVHMLDRPALRPYAGRYQGARAVEGAKA